MNLSESTQYLQSFIKKVPNPEHIPDAELKAIYQLFIDTLTDHNHLYYIEAKPIISDAEYDELFAYLKAMEEYFPTIISSTSPTQGLVGQLSDGFKKAVHQIPLLSLENSYNAEDIREWAVRVAKLAEKKGILNREYHLEPKFDGLSVECIYYDGKLIQAITRGDGKIGEDITANVMMIPSIPKQIPYLWTLQVRGEIMMPKSQLLKLNQQREHSGQTPFSNTRNAAAGTIKLLDSREVGKRGLIAFIYDQLWGEKVDLKSIGMPVFELQENFLVTRDIEQIIAWCQDFQIKHFLEEQDFDFDGLVIKVSDSKSPQHTSNCDISEKSDFSLFDTETPVNSSKDIRSALWSTEHHPRRAIAYKFPAQQVASQIQGITFQVGRTGIITPVAHIEPISLSGATIARVSLHNFDFIAKKQIKKGDFVRVQRSGEVIPYILGSIKERRNGSEEPIIPPLFCPECGDPITNIDIHYYCTNPSCPAQIREKITHFVSRDAMDISGIGEAMIEVLVKQKMLNSVADIYHLTSLQNQILLRKFPSFGEKKITELVNQIELSKKQPLRRLLNALWIPHIWKKTAQDVAEYLALHEVASLDQMISAFSNDGLADVEGIGEKSLQAIQLFMTNPETLKLLRTLEQEGVQFSAINEKTNTESSSQWTFSLTGTFPISRTDLIQQMQKLGYRYEENPTSGTTVMLIWEKPSSKAEKARKFWILIYENRETILQEFHLTIPIKLKDEKQGIIQGGLF